ncbi:pilus assembly protein PilN [Pseudidiomarina aestuarii]|uniref:Pilus assembly protein PilN n=1 Tax=Pseudidiomarina aestuarii TaxID=624146 RepID=A0A6N4DGC9_9GAMM|nr:pilus assembly protein PilN [Pseudidiomarina aestuarii]
MAHVNLLPWREIARQRAKKEFGIHAGIAIVVASVVVGIAFLVIADMQQRQQSRNTFLFGQIQILDAQIAEIQDINKQKDQIMNRVQLIKSLHEDRNTAIMILNEFSERTPDGVFLTSIEKRGRSLTITGNTVSNNRVSEFLRNLKDSPILVDPEIRQVVSDRAGAASTSNFAAFNLIVRIRSNEAEAEGAKR